MAGYGWSPSPWSVWSTVWLLGINRTENDADYGSTFCSSITLMLPLPSRMPMTRSAPKG